MYFIKKITTKLSSKRCDYPNPTIWRMPISVSVGEKLKRTQSVKVKSQGIVTA
ncbi:hypothetical protein C943_03940 [Mariniradius saccharolyticus AK6]|uniref:Uncharacterized protein n=1 Tax=Mariniradius saccharolyticus AK6 TaxID=1239962 RepID=M7XHT4_9BACT|nr:hypothetical protein C943_03940 [Mariniradius saccharolyticus AK6]